MWGVWITVAMVVGTFAYALWMTVRLPPKPPPVQRAKIKRCQEFKR